MGALQSIETQQMQQKLALMKAERESKYQIVKLEREEQEVSKDLTDAVENGNMEQAKALAKAKAMVIGQKTRKMNAHTELRLMKYALDDFHVLRAQAQMAKGMAQIASNTVKTIKPKQIKKQQREAAKAMDQLHASKAAIHDALETVIVNDEALQEEVNGEQILKQELLKVQMRKQEEADLQALDEHINEMQDPPSANTISIQDMSTRIQKLGSTIINRQANDS